MAAPLRWLEAQLEKAKRDMEEAQKRYEACSEMLKIAKAEQGIPQEGEGDRDIVSSIRKIRVGPLRPGVTMIDQISQILEDKGPLRPSEIHEALKEMQRDTTVNSVITQLNRHKETKFRKDSEGRWGLVIQQKGDLTQAEAAFILRGEVDER